MWNKMFNFLHKHNFILYFSGFTFINCASPSSNVLVWKNIIGFKWKFFISISKGVPRISPRGDQTLIDKDLNFGIHAYYGFPLNILKVPVKICCAQSAEYGQVLFVIVHEKSVVFFSSFFRNISKTAETILCKKIERNHGGVLQKNHWKNYTFRNINCFVKMSVSKLVRAILNCCGRYRL